MNRPIDRPSASAATSDASVTPDAPAASATSAIADARPAARAASRPLAIARVDRIAKALEATGSASVADLAERLGVSRETIRRDLKHLASQGKATLVHGGATHRGAQPAEPSLDARIAANVEGKAMIGRMAATLVRDGMVLMIDSGSTTFGLVAALAHFTDLTVITNSLPIAAQMCRSPGIRVIMLGGEIDGNDEAAFGVETIAAIAHFRVDLVFLGASGLSPEGDLTDFSRLAAEQRHAMMKAGPTVYVLVDHTKFGNSTPIRIAPVPHIAGLIVDKPLPEPIATVALERQWQIIVASP